MLEVRDKVKKEMDSVLARVIFPEELTMVEKVKGHPRYFLNSKRREELEEFILSIPEITVVDEEQVKGLKEDIGRKLHSEFGSTYGYSGTEDYIWKRIPQDERDMWLEMAGQILSFFQNWLKKELEEIIFSIQRLQ